jgi:hypothetical protein
VIELQPRLGRKFKSVDAQLHKAADCCSLCELPVPVYWHRSTLGALDQVSAAAVVRLALRIWGVPALGAMRAWRSGDAYCIAIGGR